jgi:hypothetical protein
MQQNQKRHKQFTFDQMMIQWVIPITVVELFKGGFQIQCVSDIETSVVSSHSGKTLKLGHLL